MKEFLQKNFAMNFAKNFAKHFARNHEKSNTWNLANETIIPSTQRIILKIVRF